MTHSSRALLSVLAFSLATLYALPSLAHAANPTITLDVEAASRTLFDGALTVAPCVATSSEPSEASGYCALEQSGLSPTWSWYPAYSSFFLDALGGISTGYWLWSFDTGSGMQSGQTSLDNHVLTDGETLLVENVAPSSPVVAAVEGAGAGAGVPPKPLFTGGVTPAVAFLQAHESPAGSFGSALLDDWAAVAFAAAGVRDAALAAQLATTSDLGSVTDYERRAMALEALGVDPQDVGGANLIAHIAGVFDGTQVGDPSLVNDDLFALLPLLHAGYQADDPLIEGIAASVMRSQGADGSWASSTDLTAAAVQALAPLSGAPGVASALSAARRYLVSQEGSDGCFGNVYATSWATQAIVALGELPRAWETPSGGAPESCLESLQQPDGAFATSTDGIDSQVWATEEAIPALAGKTWDDLLATFPRAATSTARATVAATRTTAATVAVPDTATPAVPMGAAQTGGAALRAAPPVVHTVAFAVAAPVATATIAATAPPAASVETPPLAAAVAPASSSSGVPMPAAAGAAALTFVAGWLAAGLRRASARA